MPKKTTILIAILAIVTVSLIFLAVREESQKPAEKDTSQQTVQKQPQPTEEETPKTASLSFSPAFLDLSEGGSGIQSADIFINNGDGEISGVQVELQYDPKVLTNVNIESGSDTIFGANPNILISQVDQVNGRITHIVAINLSDDQIKGVGKIATVTFQALPGTESQTKIEFLDKSIVTSLGTTNSILKDTIPLTISLPTSGGSFQQQPPPPADQAPIQ